MEKIFAKAQAQLASRAAILLQIGAAKHLKMDSWPTLGSFTFQLDSFHLIFEPEEGKAFDDEVLNEAIAELDAKIFQAKKDAQAVISLIEAWGA